METMTCHQRLVQQRISSTGLHRPKARRFQDVLYWSTQNQSTYTNLSKILHTRDAGPENTIGVESAGLFPFSSKWKSELAIFASWDTDSYNDNPSTSQMVKSSTILDLPFSRKPT